MIQFLNEVEARQALKELAPIAAADLLGAVAYGYSRDGKPYNFVDADGIDVAEVDHTGFHLNPDHPLFFYEEERVAEIDALLAEVEDLDPPPGAEDALSFADLTDDDAVDDFVIESDDEWLPSKTAGLIGPDPEDRLIDKLYW